MIPEPTDVLSYAYLWDHEARRGEVDGRKDRPVVVVIARKMVGEETELLVVPVTTQPPQNPADAFELPHRVKMHLGLDAARCWIMITEVNRFTWPGPDIRPMTRGDATTPYYGFLPEQVFAPVLAAVITRLRAGRMRVTKRGE